MQYQIKSRNLNRTFTFTRPAGGYIFVDLNGLEGTLGNQICRGGALVGSCVEYYGESQEFFDTMCRNWYRSFMRREADSLTF